MSTSPLAVLSRRYPLLPESGSPAVPDDVLAWQAGNDCPGDSLGVTEAEREACYQAGLQAYLRADYVAARQAFVLLFVLYPTDGHVLLALGSSLQQLGQTLQARALFAASVQALPTHPGAWFRLAECLATDAPQAARVALQHCLALCASQPATPGLYQQAAALLDRLS